MRRMIALRAQRLPMARLASAMPMAFLRRAEPSLQPAPAGPAGEPGRGTAWPAARPGPDLTAGGGRKKMEEDSGGGDEGVQPVPPPAARCRWSTACRGVAAEADAVRVLSGERPRTKWLVQPEN